MSSNTELTKADREWLLKDEDVLYPLEPPKGSGPSVVMLVLGAIAALVLAAWAVSWVAKDDDSSFPVQSQPTPTTKEAPK